MLNTRKAIVDKREGVTRDRAYGTMDWTGHSLIFVDTGGYIPLDVDIFNAAVREQAQLAVAEADLILFMVDGRAAPTSSDVALAKFIRETNKPYILAVNKCDSIEMDSQIYLYHELGLETVMPISALNGRSTGDLLEAIVEKLDYKYSQPEENVEEGLRLAIVGMPNVGKSSLVNALLQKEQLIVTPIAGTTRDSIDTKIRWYGKEITLVDTAGLRKKSKVTDSIEYFSSIRTHQAIERSDVVLVLIDAIKKFGKQDKSIVEHVIKEGKALVILVNKWDLIEKDSNTMQTYISEITNQYKYLSNFPIYFISALTRQRVSNVLDQAYNVYQTRSKKISTRQLNQWLEKVLMRHPVPAVKGKLIKIKFVTQVHTAPPVIAFYCNYPKLIPVHYRRMIENQFRDAFDFSGVPIIFSFRNK